METTIFAIPNNIQVDKKTFTKMYFIYNAINNGWCVNKKTNMCSQSDTRKVKKVFSENLP